jgi:hypothetical protein
MRDTYAPTAEPKSRRRSPPASTSASPATTPTASSGVSRLPPAWRSRTGVGGQDRRAQHPDTPLARRRHQLPLAVQRKPAWLD